MLLITTNARKTHRIKYVKCYNFWHSATVSSCELKKVIFLIPHACSFSSNFDSGSLHIFLLFSLINPCRHKPNSSFLRPIEPKNQTLPFSLWLNSKTQHRLFSLWGHEVRWFLVWFGGFRGSDLVGLGCFVLVVLVLSHLGGAVFVSVDLAFLVSKVVFLDGSLLGSSMGLGGILATILSRWLAR